NSGTMVQSRDQVLIGSRWPVFWRSTLASSRVSTYGPFLRDRLIAFPYPILAGARKKVTIFLCRPPAIGQRSRVISGYNAGPDAVGAGSRRWMVYAFCASYHPWTTRRWDCTDAGRPPSVLRRRPSGVTPGSLTCRGCVAYG